MNSRTPPPGGRGERGYITLFVLAIAAAAFMAVAVAMQTNRCLRESNRRQAGLLQARAAAVSVRP